MVNNLVGIINNVQRFVQDSGGAIIRKVYSITRIVGFPKRFFEFDHNFVDRSKVDRFNGGNVASSRRRYKTFFSTSLTSQVNKLERFVAGKRSQPILLLTGAYPSKAPFR
jgi:hypothetical protein